MVCYSGGRTRRYSRRPPCRLPPRRLRSLPATSCCRISKNAAPLLAFFETAHYVSSPETWFKIKKRYLDSVTLNLAGAGLGFQSQTSCLLLPAAFVRCRARPCALFLPLVGAHFGSSPYGLKKKLI